MKFRGDGTVYACTALAAAGTAPGLVGAPMTLVVAGLAVIAAACGAAVAATARTTR